MSLLTSFHCYCILLASLTLSKWFLVILHILLTSLKVDQDVTWIWLPHSWIGKFTKTSWFGMSCKPTSHQKTSHQQHYILVYNTCNQIVRIDQVVMVYYLTSETFFHIALPIAHILKWNRKVHKIKMQFQKMVHHKKGEIRKFPPSKMSILWTWMSVWFHFGHAVIVSKEHTSDFIHTYGLNNLHSYVF
jgi:hypothetical protein